MNAKFLSHQKRLSGKRRILWFVLVLALADVLVWNAFRRPVIAHTMLGLSRYTVAELAQYDGTDRKKPTLLAYDGIVYDVSKGREKFYAPGKPYHMLAGTDASALLHIAGGDIIVQKYQAVGRIIP